MQRTIFAATLAVAGSASAVVEIEQGKLACRSEKAFHEYQTARLAGDKAAMDWLVAGAACVPLERDTLVEVVEAQGETRKVRTLDRRRNLVLWTDSHSLEAHAPAP